MSYLFDRVNSELMDRIVLAGSSQNNWLQIDFKASTLELPGKNHFKCFPLDGDNILEKIANLKKKMDGAVVNLPFAWLAYEELLPLLRSNLRPGARLFFVTFGPDTLIELRQAWAGVDALPHVHDFTDMHHIGDSLLSAGYSKPIVDVDWVGIEYQDIDLLMQDLRQEGFHNILSNRRKTLTGKHRQEEFKKRVSGANGLTRITFELVYGYAEVAPDRQNKVRVSLPTTD